MCSSQFASFICRHIQKGFSQISLGRRRIVPKATNPSLGPPPHQRRHRALNKACGAETRAGTHFQVRPPVPKDFDSKPPMLPVLPPPAPEGQPSACKPPTPKPSQPTRPLSSAPDAAECQAGLAQPTQPEVGGGGGGRVALPTLFYLLLPTQPAAITATLAQREKV